MKVHVSAGRIVRIENGSEGQTAHRMCARGRAYRQRVYAPDRLLYPLKRTGARGAGRFARVSWDEALDDVAREMTRVRDAYGNAAILHFCSMADAHPVHHVQTFHRLLCQFGGYTAPWGFISNEGQAFSAGTTYGTRPTEPDPEKYLNSRLIIMWSWNPVVTHQGTRIPSSLARAKEGGTGFISVDPRYTDSAATFADQWIPIRPGTDVAALVAMAHVIIRERLHDRHFVDTYTVGFDRFSDYVLGLEDGLEKTPEWAEAIIGIPAATLTNLARRYAAAGPAVLEGGYAAGRTAFGEQFHRAIAVLEAITGNTMLRSGGQAALAAVARIARIPSPPNQIEIGVPPRWNALPYRGASVNSSARVNVSLLADAILKGTTGGYPADYRFLWLSNNNYLNQLAEVNKAIEAFRKLDFVLVTEQFMSSSARFADIVLPVCTFLERHDLNAPKAVEPLGESKSQLQICEALAAKLGIPDYNDKSDEEWVRFMTTRLTEEFDKSAAASRKEPDDSAHKLFPTPSGKIEIYSSTIADMNHPLIPPVPRYVETWESLNDPLARKYPLQLITPHFRLRAHSQFDNLPWLRDLETQAITISTLDAGSRGIGEGDMVRVFNDRGEVVIAARVTERIMPGVVSLPEGAWYRPDEKGIDHGGCANVLTRNVTSPAGAFPSNTALVQVERVER
jgi:anaerobic dimethyl sulfoxide reductase subunit A